MNFIGKKMILTMAARLPWLNAAESYLLSSELEELLTLHRQSHRTDVDHH